MSPARVLLPALLAAMLAPCAWAQATQAPAARAAADPAGDAFKAWDTDRNGSLSPAEFRAGWQQMQRLRQVQARLHQQFTLVDADKSGALEPGEYAGLMLVRNAGKSAPPLARFDANANGKLEFAEYLRLVDALAPAQAAKAAGK